MTLIAATTLGKIAAALLGIFLAVFVVAYGFSLSDKQKDRPPIGDGWFPWMASYLPRSGIRIVYVLTAVLILGLIARGIFSGH